MFEKFPDKGDHCDFTYVDLFKKEIPETFH